VKGNGAVNGARPLELTPIARTPQPGEAFVFWSWHARFLGAVVPLLAGAAAVAVAVVAPRPASLVALPFAAVGIALVLRASRLVLVLGFDGVEAANTLRTHRVPWREVDAVFLAPDCIGFLVKTRRRSVEATATRGRRRDGRLLRELRRYAEAHGIRVDPQLES
jgi:hypothetical protein